MSATAAKLPGLRAQMAFAGRKFHAWWEGYAFDDAAERAALQAQFPAAGATDGRPATDVIAEAIWGEGRLEPGAPVWTMRFARMLSLPVRANVIIFGAGAGAPLNDLKHGTRWKLSGLTQSRQYAHGGLRSYDTALQRIEKASAAGALSFFDLHRDSNPSAFASFAADFMTPGAKAVFIDFAVARRGVRLRSCFAQGKKGAPRTDSEYRDALRSAGFAVDEVTDETETFMTLIARGWAGWRRAYAALNTIENQRLRADLIKAMSGQAKLWAERYEAMKSGQLRVVSIRATRK